MAFVLVVLALLAALGGGMGFGFAAGMWWARERLVQRAALLWVDGRRSEALELLGVLEVAHE